QNDYHLPTPLPAIIDLRLCFGRHVIGANHHLFSDWMALPAVFPNLQALGITFQFAHCDQCHIRPKVHWDESRQPKWPGLDDCIDATLHCLTGSSNLPQLLELQVRYSYE